MPLWFVLASLECNDVAPKEALEIVVNAASRVPLVMEQNEILRQAIQVLAAAINGPAPKLETT